jgi:hypothetical protein
VTVSVATSGLDTGSWLLRVKNPGAAPSNPLSYNVTPGAPTLASVSPGSAPQGDAPVTVTLTGANFAKPDAAGNAGSVVHIASPELGVVDHVIPTADTTVVDAQTIRIRLDTRSAVPGFPYDVSVWNAGGPQKSNVLENAFTVTAP